MIGRRFGADMVAHIRAMASQRLERDLLTGKLDVPAVTLGHERTGQVSLA